MYEPATQPFWPWFSETSVGKELWSFQSVHQTTRKFYFRRFIQSPQPSPQLHFLFPLSYNTIKWFSFVCASFISGVNRFISSSYCSSFDFSDSTATDVKRDCPPSLPYRSRNKGELTLVDEVNFVCKSTPALQHRESHLQMGSPCSDSAPRASHVKVKISNGQLQRWNKDILSFGYM